jgi:hypothetical protein
VSPAAASRRHRLLLLLFFASGASGLIYQVVWMRALARVASVILFLTTLLFGATFPFVARSVVATSCSRARIATT